MTEEEKAAMEQFEITYEQRKIFIFQDYKYERLADAIKYAQSTIDTETPLVSEKQG